MVLLVLAVALEEASKSLLRTSQETELFLLLAELDQLEAVVVAPVADLLLVSCRALMPLTLRVRAYAGVVL